MPFERKAAVGLAGSIAVLPLDAFTGRWNRFVTGTMATADLNSRFRKMEAG
jgi:hypothetical protein